MVNIIKEEFSLPEQKERLEALCKLKGWKIIDYYEDAKSKRINTVIALKLDRLSRSIYD